MKCPFCHAPETIVKDTRETEEGKVIRRRRSCTKCKGRFTTFERIQLRELSVIKKSGAKRPFDRNKILKSISTALRKRNFSDEVIENIANNIILEIESSSAREVESRAIGKLIMSELAKIDPVAYIRFASVYKDFANAQDFARFIGQIKN
ncbi:MAG: transcriptional repressor NrdR [Rickettsiales bacterium]|nr:transcriptional repressor NrdR [Rickettsiales bacterium]MCA0254470.1 transcriptional regulator NrdR [Pseudomonadota bacterium]